MNEFTRIAMEFADMFENAGRCWLSASPKNAERLKERRDDIRSALLAHLEGGEQKWLPIETAPMGVRVLLGPRRAPVVGMVSHPEWWQEGEVSCCVVHYNGNILIADYHCSEWAPLHATPTEEARK